RQLPIWRDADALWAYTVVHNPDCVPCRENLALLLVERGDLDAAAAEYERAIGVRMEATGVLGYCAVRLQQGRVEDAAALCALARRLDPLQAKAAYNEGLVFDRQGKREEAIAAYRDAVRLDPDWPDPRNNLGADLLRTGRVEEARPQFEETLRLHPDDVEAQLNLAVIAQRDGDWAEAERHARNALADAGDDAQRASARHDLGLALERQGERSEAIEHYRA